MTRARFDARRGLIRPAPLRSLDRLPYWPEVILVANEAEAQALAAAFRARTGPGRAMPVLVVAQESGVEPGRASMFRTALEAAASIPLADGPRLLEAVRAVQRRDVIDQLAARAEG